jgi:hypothetical protein
MLMDSYGGQSNYTGKVGSKPGKKIPEHVSLPINKGKVKDQVRDGVCKEGLGEKNYNGSLTQKRK